MGMEQAVSFAGRPIPAWPAVSDLLIQRGFPVEVRMIDGELTFPDEVPPPTWRELRLGTPGGMVTLRREFDRVVFVTWGNANEPLLQAWNALTWAFAQAGEGKVLSPNGPLSAADFLHTANLPPSLRLQQEQRE